MKPYYWIGLGAMGGALVATVLHSIFPNISIFKATTGTILGLAVGIAIYTDQLFI